MDYYKILGIKNTSTDKEIKNAYRMLAKKFHPDAYKGNKDIAESKMKELNEAYDVLSDEKKRKDYDEKINPPKPTYEENAGSNYTAYSNTDGYAEHGVGKNPNQGYSGYYYNYAPYEGEKYYGHPDYKTYDFSEIKKTIKNKFKHLLFVVTGIIVLTIICISLIFRLLWNALDGVIQYGNNAYVRMQEDKKSEAEEKTSSELTKEDIQKAIDAAEQKAQEWYNTEGKGYEEEWNKIMEELKIQVQEELKSRNADT